GVMVVDPPAQALEADVRGVVGVVVDPERRAVAEQHVGRREPPGELARLALAVLVRGALAVAHAALEAGDGDAAAELGAAQVHVLDLEVLEQVVWVVVAVDAVAREGERHQRLDPRGVEVAEAEHRVHARLPGHRGGVERRRLVGEREDAHQVRRAASPPSRKRRASWGAARGSASIASSAFGSAASWASLLAWMAAIVVAATS